MDNHKSRQVHFREDVKDPYDIVPYSEMFHDHPHFILATRTSWKPLPSRADDFTGKSSAVMQSRRSSIKKSRARGLRTYRRRLINQANRELQQINYLEDKIVEHAPMLVDHTVHHVLADQHAIGLHDYNYSSLIFWWHKAELFLVAHEQIPLVRTALFRQRPTTSMVGRTEKKKLRMTMMAMLLRWMRMFIHFPAA